VTGTDAGGPDHATIDDHVTAGTSAPAEGRSCTVAPAIACDAALDPWTHTARELAMVAAESMAVRTLDSTLNSGADE
jgi:hypothetical protein